MVENEIEIGAQLALCEKSLRITGEDINVLNDWIWNEEYKKAIEAKDFAIVVGYSKRLEKIAKANRIKGEIMARVILTSSRLVYFRDKKAGKTSDEAYQIAMRGLEYAEEPGTKVSLYNVASDTMGELVGDYERGAELANASCEIAKTGSDVDWGKAENNTALRYLNLAKRFVASGENEKAKTAFDNAIAHFEKARDAHQKAGDKRQLGHAYSNMILCYKGLANLDSPYYRRVEMCNKALEQAKLAKEAYGDDIENALHAISANYRKGQVHELEAKIMGSERRLLFAVRCYTENATKALELDKPEKAKQELGNILKIVQ